MSTECSICEVSTRIGCDCHKGEPPAASDGYPLEMEILELCKTPNKNCEDCQDCLNEGKNLKRIKCAGAVEVEGRVTHGWHKGMAYVISDCFDAQEFSDKQRVRVIILPA